ncbi:MAG: hypothetical protein QOC57_323 [Ilumatobacteraceae bacterium]|jgi:hypothetical protein
MTTPIEVWLQAADSLLGRPEPSDDHVDELIEQGLAIDETSEPVSVDPVQLERVLAVLRARSAAMASEMSDLARRRVELTRAQTGTTEYLNAASAVPMD